MDLPRIKSGALSKALGSPSVKVWSDLENPSSYGDRVEQVLKSIYGALGHEAPIEEVVRQVHVFPDPGYDQRGAGKYTRGNRSIKVFNKAFQDEGELANTVGHELRHALDFHEGLLTGPASESVTPDVYWTMPSEVRARATGNYSRFLHESDPNQGSFDPNLLQDWSGLLESIKGARIGDTYKLNETNKRRDRLLGSRYLEERQSEPRQKMIPFEPWT
jgi:hypothetical protein